MTRSDSTSQMDPAINFSELLARVEDDQELLQDLIAMFREEYPLQRKALQGAVDAADAKHIHATGHTLKGMFANLAMTRASRIAARIELIGKEHMGSEQNAAELQCALRELDEEAACIFAALDMRAADAKVPDTHA